MQPLNAVPRHTAISISARIRFIRASLVSSEANIFGAQITSVFVCNLFMIQICIAPKHESS
jgi:hypothetical protein